MPVDKKTDRGRRSPRKERKEMAKAIRANTGGKTAAAGNKAPAGKNAFHGIRYNAVNQIKDAYPGTLTVPEMENAVKGQKLSREKAAALRAAFLKKRDEFVTAYSPVVGMKLVKRPCTIAGKGYDSIAAAIFAMRQKYRVEIDSLEVSQGENDNPELSLGDVIELIARAKARAAAENGTLLSEAEANEKKPSNLVKYRQERDELRASYEDASARLQELCSAVQAIDARLPREALAREVKKLKSLAKKLGQTA